MNWDDYTTLMAANGQQVYATEVGHHGVYSGVEKTSPTVYPHRLDTHEMRLAWVMEREVWPRLKGMKDGIRPHRIFYSLRCRSTLFHTLLADITRNLVAEGFEVTERGDGSWSMSWVKD